jgi:hypothetical protein
MDDSRLEMLQEVSSCAEALFQASQDAGYASNRVTEIREEISNARNLISNLEIIVKRAEENYVVKRKIANELYFRLEAAKTALDLAEQSD